MMRVGVTGYGYWGPNLVRNFHEFADTEVRMVCDRDETRLKKVKQKYPDIPVCADFSEMVNNPDIDIIAIATPVSTHYELALAALNMGKHVWIEKPITHHAEQAEHLIEVARENGLTLFVDHTFVYTGAVRKIKELIDEGVIGDVYYYDSVRINLGLFQHDISVVWDLAVHDLSILDYTLHPAITQVSCTGMSHVPNEPANIAYMTLYGNDHLICHIHVNWLAPAKVRKTLFGGSKKMIVYDDLEPSEKIKIYDKGIAVNGERDKDKLHDIIQYRRTGDVLIPYVDVSEALQKGVAHFIQCINEKKEPITNGEAGLRIVKILEAGSISKQNHGAPVDVNL